MKILFIADSTSIHTQRWLRYFLNAGNDIYIITLGKKRKRIEGAKHIANFDQFYYNSFSFISVLKETRKIVRSIKPEILHGHFVHQYGWLASLCNFHPLILTAWGTDILSLPHTSRSRIGKKLTQYALKKADLITGTSEYLKNEMRKLGADENKIHVVHWGVDLDKFRPDVDTRQIREQLEIDNRPVVLSNRLHLELYNNDIIIEAMYLVVKRIPEALLVLQNAGGPPDEALIRLARDKGINDSIRFVAQFPHDELPALYAIADLYVSVPSWDGGPVSPIEAMACGAVPIISAVPGPMEWVQDGINGTVVPVRNADKLAGAICDLLLDVDRRKKFNRINRALIKERGDHKASMKQMEQLYKAIINQPV